MFAAVGNEDDELLGYVICSMNCDTREGYIVDLIAAGDISSKVVLRLLMRATSFLAQSGCISIRGWKVSEHPFDKILSEQYPKLGFFHIKKGAPVIIRPIRRDDDTLRYVNIDNWYMSRIFTQGISS